jgi:hypothetical protein
MPVLEMELPERRRLLELPLELPLHLLDLHLLPLLTVSPLAGGSIPRVGLRIITSNWWLFSVKVG